MAVAYIAVEYVSDDGVRTSFNCSPGSRAHREALEHERAGVCVVIHEVDEHDFEVYPAY